MQAAYKRYKNASEALDTLVVDASVIRVRDGLETHNTAVERQAAFEDYMEARLHFSEVFLARVTASERHDVAANGRMTLRAQIESGRWNVLKSRFPMVVAFLGTGCSLALNVAYLLRDFGAGEHNKLAALKSKQFASQQSSSTSGSRFSAKWQVSEPKLQQTTRLEALPQVQNEEQPAELSTPAGAVKSGANLTSKTHSQSERRRVSLKKPDCQHCDHYPFTLSPSTRYYHLGSLNLRARSVDLKHEYFDLSIILRDGSKLEKKHVRRYERVRIDLGGRKGYAELIASSISKNRVRGYLIETKRLKSELAIEPRIKRNTNSPTTSFTSE